jgi:tellurite resistance protein
MVGFLILLLAVELILAAIIFPNVMGLPKLADLLKRFKRKNLFTNSCPVRTNNQVTSSIYDLPDTKNEDKEPDLNVLNCRIQRKNHQEGGCIVDAFSVEICGSIHAPSDKNNAVVRISIQDITEGSVFPKPVQAKVKQWQAADSDVFCYSTDLGRLPNHVTILSNWTSVARLRVDWLVFPYKGRRNLRFDISIYSARDNQELASALCCCNYDNPSFGYMELQENIERTKTLAVALAFAVSAADNRMYDCEIKLIKKWARDNIDPSLESDRDGRKLDKALNEIVNFFRDGNKLDSYEICREIVEIAPATKRYDVLDLCLHVAKANGSVAIEELEMLKNLANWLEIDGEKFRTMMEKVIPVEMHEVKDIESILGVTSDMNEDKTRAHLNKEYVKWNARVTNTNPEIQSQADQMLKLIAEARAQYIQNNLSVNSESDTLVKQVNTK